MKGICPFCEAERDIEPVKTRELIKVRGEAIDVEAHYLKCAVCANTFEDPRSEHDPLDLAYREYRKRHNMTQPEEIREFRKRYGLTQGELSKILGWGIATLNRYENGALQDDAHEKTLRLAMQPENFLRLIEKTPDALSKEKRERLVKELRAEEEDALSFERIFEVQFGRYEPDKFSGYRKLDLAKLFNAILFFCKGEGAVKTKLNKLLFYADFKHFKEYAVSITGARYAHVPFGPAPDNFNHYFAVLIGNDSLAVEEIEYADNVVGEKFISVKQPDLTIFSDSELKILSSVKEYFKDFTATKITEFSHEEEGYKETGTGEMISYKYAERLKV